MFGSQATFRQQKALSVVSFALHFGSNAILWQQWTFSSCQMCLSPCILDSCYRKFPACLIRGRDFTAGVSL